MSQVMCAARRAVDVLAVLLLLATAAQGAEVASSCYNFGLGTAGGSSFSGGIKKPLATNGVASGSAIYGVVYQCSKGNPTPSHFDVGSVKYYLDDKYHSGMPTATKPGLSPFKLDLAGLAPGQHYLTVVVTFKNAMYRPFVGTRSFRTPKVGTIQKFKQCGGAGGRCGGTGKACKDAPWTGAMCASGSTCRRQNKFYWQCL